MGTYNDKCVITLLQKVNNLLAAENKELQVKRKGLDEAKNKKVNGIMNGKLVEFVCIEEAFEKSIETCQIQEARIEQLHAENKELKETIEAALAISDIWTLGEVETMFADEAKALEAMKNRFEQALKGGES